MSSPWVGFFAAALLWVLWLCFRPMPRRCPDCGATKGEIHKPRCNYGRK